MESTIESSNIRIKWRNIVNKFKYYNFETKKIAKILAYVFRIAALIRNIEVLHVNESGVDVQGSEMMEKYQTYLSNFLFSFLFCLLRTNSRCEEFRSRIYHVCFECSMHVLG